MTECDSAHTPRSIPRIAEEQNVRLEAAGHTPLMIEEGVAGRLYTGPMYEKYNAVRTPPARRSHRTAR